jgi:DNA-binding response OmpR family regulator
MAPRLLLVSANAASRLRSDLARVGEVARVTPEDLEGAQDPPPGDCVILDLVGYRGNAAALSETVSRVSSLSGKPLLAVVSEQDLATFDWPAEINDLIVVPYRPGELQARLKRALSSGQAAPSASAIAVGEIALDPESYEVRVRGACVDLTLKEYELLKHLISHPGRVFTRDQLLSGIWGYEYFGGTRTVDVHIRRLRMKLGEVGERSIDTVRGVGYVFRP